MYYAPYRRPLFEPGRAQIRARLMTEVAEAEALIARHMPSWPGQVLALEDVTGRVLRDNVSADRDLPAFDRVTMDGIAIAFADYANGRRRFALAGTQGAGVPALRIGTPGECVKVMTGAVCPEGADSVIPIERIELRGNEASVAPNAEVEAGQFLHRRGSDCQSGAQVLCAGLSIGAPEMAVLASTGKSRVAVARLPSVAVVSTGDELVGVADAVAPHQIRSSNDRAIATALERERLASVERLRLRDEESAMLERVEHLHERHDVLILSGGVSMGDFDFVPGVLAQLGCELVFHRINQKPGRPMWFGLSRAGKPIFALPGNPVSTLVCMARYVVPAFRRALGSTELQTERVVLTHPPKSSPPRMTHFVPVRLHWSESGAVHAVPRDINTSGDFVSLAGTDGIIELPPDPARREAGSVVSFYRW